MQIITLIIMMIMLMREEEEKEILFKCKLEIEVETQDFAKDCLLTLVKSRLALGSPGCSVGWLFVTMPKMAEYTEK